MPSFTSASENKFSLSPPARVSPNKKDKVDHRRYNNKKRTYRDLDVTHERVVDDEAIVEKQDEPEVTTVPVVFQASRTESSSGCFYPPDPLPETLAIVATPKIKVKSAIAVDGTDEGPFVPLPRSLTKPHHRLHIRETFRNCEEFLKDHDLLPSNPNDARRHTDAVRSMNIGQYRYAARLM